MKLNILSQDELLHLISSRLKNQGAFSMALIDLDKWNDKSLNLDELILDFRRVLESSSFEEFHYIGRDEFILFVDESIEKTFQQLFEFKLHWERDRKFDVTYSAGLVSVPSHGNTPEEVLRRAEEGLFKAKQQGRNMICQPDNGSLVLKSNYYYKYQLDRLKTIAKKQKKKESEILRLALDEYFRRHDDL
jgi:GGDEF domain-containing protein